MKTTLIYAGIAGRGFNCLSQGMDAGWVSHGLGSISAAAKAQGFQIDLIDLRALQNWDHFREELKKRDPDVIGLTMMSVDYNPVTQALAIAQEVLPEAVTIVGGPHVTLALEDSLRRSGWVYASTAEYHFRRMVDAILFALAGLLVGVVFNLYFGFSVLGIAIVASLMAVAGFFQPDWAIRQALARRSELLLREMGFGLERIALFLQSGAELSDALAALQADAANDAAVRKALSDAASRIATITRPAERRAVFFFPSTVSLARAKIGDNHGSYHTARRKREGDR